MIRALALAVSALAGASVALAGCGSSPSPPPAVTTAVTQTVTLPGTGKPPVTIGDKNYTEQFVLGELYYQALHADGFPVTLNQNIGPTSVTLQALESGRLALYPEYLATWNASIAGDAAGFRSVRASYEVAQRYALARGLRLLNATPFSDTDGIAVTVGYGAAHHLRRIADLRRVAQTLAFGGPPQFEQAATGLAGLEQAYGFTPAAFQPLEIGQQYAALDAATVQAAAVNTTDAQLTSGNYRLLADPLHVLGWGNVVPVASANALRAEGPIFVQIINRVSSLLTTPVMRELNAAVDLVGEDPAAVARRFLIDHGVIQSPQG